MIGHAGGVVFRVGGRLYFLPASIAVKVLPVPAIARIPGAPPGLLGVGLVEGEMVPIVAAGDPDLPVDMSSASTGPGASAVRSMLVVGYLGERLGLVGAEVEATGRFEAEPRETAHPEQVAFGEETARLFDVAAIIARVREGRWAV